MIGSSVYELEALQSTVYEHKSPHEQTVLSMSTRQLTETVLSMSFKHERQFCLQARGLINFCLRAQCTS